MKYAVLGAGLMGKEVARDLVQSPNVDQVVLADVDLEKAKCVCQQLDSPKLSPAFLDATDFQSLTSFLAEFDVAVNALFYTFNERVARAGIKAGVHVCDLGGHIGHETDKVLQLAEEAQAAGVTLIPDLGVAPGMTNILAGYGASKLDQVDSMYLRVGGIPLNPEPPLEYNQVFSIEGVFDHYTDPSLVIRDGKTYEVPSLSEVETIYFEKFGPLEAFHTAGGTSTLSRSFPNLKNLDYKTIRYPGHAEKARLLVDLNLTRRDYEVTIGGQRVRPRDVLREVLKPIVDLKDKDDVVLLRVTVQGLKEGIETTYEYEMVTYKDRTKNVTAMARTTAYTISAVAQMLGNGVITKRGAYPPEQIVPGDHYIEEMKKREIVIQERVIKETVRREERTIKR
ncbi:Saccharopine dehydrogenase [Caldalkalibacillus thermarum TA2.A1]|uniref:Saccharopine dehydrogenase n=1 Tax=Caldalkalibacillus thermarum (strain TA2.A1) TaxID=986075 RepID=F5L4C9_CALTT|nr:saccharopine dehydrogenase C-terminal domain-containing protein [Caldalkalibacillus thermarum]EGL83801.1 Saccharopine dehydrogenase [Caldalkalibacillus thermarum TA2.A1]